MSLLLFQTDGAHAPNSDKVWPPGREIARLLMKTLRETHPSITAHPKRSIDGWIWKVRTSIGVAPIMFSHEKKLSGGPFWVVAAGTITPSWRTIFMELLNRRPDTIAHVASEMRCALTAAVSQVASAHNVHWIDDPEQAAELLALREDPNDNLLTNSRN